MARNFQKMRNLLYSFVQYWTKFLKFPENWLLHYDTNLAVIICSLIKIYCIDLCHAITLVQAGDTSILRLCTMYKQMKPVSLTPVFFFTRLCMGIKEETATLQAVQISALTYKYLFLFSNRLHNKRIGNRASTYINRFTHM